MIYVRTTRDEMLALPFVHSVSEDLSEDQFAITWKHGASRMMGGCPINGNAYVLYRWQIDALPEHIEAENWWHLCALIGTTEPPARVFYKELGDGETP
jgi:hypothetical protein